jgi:hypothetical protein
MVYKKTKIINTFTIKMIKNTNNNLCIKFVDGGGVSYWQ